MRVELAAVQRELGGVREAEQVEVRARERLSHDLQVKTGQVHSLEGQLESTKKLTHNLTQEIKRWDMHTHIILSVYIPNWTKSRDND